MNELREVPTSIYSNGIYSFEFSPVESALNKGRQPRTTLMSISPRSHSILHLFAYFSRDYEVQNLANTQFYSIFHEEACLGLAGSY